MKPSSAMIPGEIAVCAFGLVLAIFGGLIDGPLHTALLARHSALAWLLLLGAPALLMLWLDLREWRRCSRWDMDARHRSARWRSKCALLQAFCWLFAVYFGFATDGAALVGFFGLVGGSYCAWSYVENRRVRREISIAAATLAN